MEHPSEVVRGFYDFCMQSIQNLRERPKIKELLGEAFTFEQAFWIHVVSMALCTWNNDSENEIRLSEIFRVYLTIYREEINRNISLEDELLFLKLLKERYDKANKIIYDEEHSKAGLHLARLALGEEDNVNRLVLAALDIPWCSVAISPIPFKLIEDI